MLPMETIRPWQLDMLSKTVQIVSYIMEKTAREDAITCRDGGDGWTVLEVLCHLRDFDDVFLERAKLTVENDFPDLPFTDPDKMAAERKYYEQDFQAVYREWSARRETLVTYFQALGDDAWERAANHPVRGRFTLNDQLIVTAWHDVSHMEQMIRILTEKRS